MTRNRTAGHGSLRFIWNEAIQRHDFCPATFSGLSVFGIDYWERLYRGRVLWGRHSGFDQIGERLFEVAFMVMRFDGAIGLSVVKGNLMVRRLAAKSSSGSGCGFKGHQLSGLG